MSAVVERKPLLPPISLNKIPEELKAIARWSPWKAIWSDERNKWDKIPFSSPEHGRSTAKPEQWTSFETAMSLLDKHPGVFAGVGYVLTKPHGIIGYDLDDCVEDGVLADWAMDIVLRLNTYTEFSPTGTGIRMFCRGEVPSDWTNHPQGIEVYAGYRPRFLTASGEHFFLAPTTVNEIAPEVHAEIADLYKRRTQTAEVIDIVQPDLLPEDQLPELGSLFLPEKVLALLDTGEWEGDRSALLFSTGIALFNNGLTDQQVFSILVHNPFVFEIALDKRRQDDDRAMQYLWREHCLKAKPKSTFISADEFDVVEGELADSAAEDANIPAFARDQNGRILATIDNVCMAVREPRFIGLEIRKDTFKDEIVLSVGDGNWRAFRDDDYTRLRVLIERRGFKAVSKDMIRDAVELIAVENEFDTAIYWLEGLPAWDGIPRIATFLPDHFGTDDTPYTRAVSTYIWSAMAGRVMCPGIKADMVPVLIGAQGVRKSSAIEAMVPSFEFFCELDIDERREENNSRKMRGCLIAELAELKGLRSRELEYVKSFITRTHEKWVPKFKEFSHTFPRRLIFIGTTNEDRFLRDDSSGYRRWLPVVSQSVNLDGIKELRDQLWSEAKVYFDVNGIAFNDAELLAKQVHASHTLQEPWAEIIGEWLELETDFDEKPSQKSYLLLREVLSEAIRLQPSQIDRRAEMRCADALKEVGYERKRISVNGKQTWVYVKRAEGSPT